MDWAGEYGVETGDVVNVLGVDHVFYDKEMRTGGSLAWNDYNPGNIITAHGEAVEYGAFPGKANGRFAIFPDEATGFEAIRRFLRRREHLSILEMMRLYAPDGDGPNDATAYAGRVADALGRTVHSPVSEIDDDGLTTFAQTVQRVEGWNPGTSHGPDDLPDDIVTWLDTFPDPAERAANDQPFASLDRTGPGVANLQQKLADLGYDIGPGGADGQFGPATRDAVMAFQRDAGLSPVDGVCGHDTWVALVG